MEGLSGVRKKEPGMNAYQKGTMDSEFERLNFYLVNTMTGCCNELFDILK